MLTVMFSMKERAMFKAEEIYAYDRQKQAYVVVGCEVLADTSIPNQYLFSAENSALEFFLFTELMTRHRASLPYIYSSDFFWTVNFSPSTICLYKNDLMRLPRNLFIEITERGSFDDFESFRPFADRLIFDDFGTGHSNMDAIHRIRPYGVKIEKELLENCSAAFLTSLVTELRKSVKVVFAEKVETEEQLSMMQRIGADFFQGWHMKNKILCLK